MVQYVHSQYTILWVNLFLFILCLSFTNNFLSKNALKQDLQAGSISNNMTVFCIEKKFRSGFFLWQQKRALPHCLISFAAYIYTDLKAWGNINDLFVYCQIITQSALHKFVEIFSHPVFTLLSFHMKDKEDFAVLGYKKAAAYLMVVDGCEKCLLACLG